MQHTLAITTPANNRQALAMIGAELIAYRVNRTPEQRAHLLGLVRMAATFGALSASDHATLSSNLTDAYHH
jgi:hypothetical protein